MKYYVTTSKENFKFLSNKKISNININNENISFHTNSKSLQNLLKDINDLTYINRRKIKIMTFIKKYLISIIGIFILIIFLINEQFVIKNIVFINENTYNQEVIDYLYNEKLNKKLVYYYLNDSIININKLLKQKFYYYEWININKKGNIIQVIIDKQDEKSYLDEESNIIGDIVSSRDGIIRYYFIKKGVNLVKDNQSINKGDILVSGNLLFYNNETQYIHPIGIVLAEVVDIENVKISKKEIKYLRTGNVKTENKIYLFDFINKKCNFEMYEEECNIIFDYKFIKKIKTTFYEIKETINYYNYDSALKYSYSIIEKQFNNNKINDKEKILEHFLLNYTEDNNYYYFKYMIKKIVNISEFKPVKLEDN